MPEEFNPAWEYACGDPDVEEILYGKQPPAYERLFDFRAENRGWNQGLRFGVGNPNSVFLKLGKEKKGQREAEEVEDRKCDWCGGAFTPKGNSSKQVFCSRACANRDHWEANRQLPRQASCSRCGGPFTPLRAEHRFCSRACGCHAGLAARTDFRRKGGPPPEGGCPVCHGPVGAWSGRGTPKKYCSKACKMSDIRRRYTGRARTVSEREQL